MKNRPPKVEIIGNSGNTKLGYTLKMSDSGTENWIIERTGRNFFKLISGNGNGENEVFLSLTPFLGELEDGNLGYVLVEAESSSKTEDRLCPAIGGDEALAETINELLA